MIHFSEKNDGKIELVFEIDNKTEKAQADLVVGADGIRSMIRRVLISEKENPLCYTGYIVILGICFLRDIADTQSTLLD